MCRPFVGQDNTKRIVFTQTTHIISHMNSFLSFIHLNIFSGKKYTTFLIHIVRYHCSKYREQENVNKRMWRKLMQKLTYTHPRCPPLLNSLTINNIHYNRSYMKSLIVITWMKICATLYPKQCLYKSFASQKINKHLFLIFGSIRMYNIWM